MKAESSYLVAVAPRNGRHDLPCETFADEVPRGPSSFSAALHDRTRAVQLGLEGSECLLDELSTDPRGDELVPDERVTGAPPGERCGATLGEPPIVEEPGALKRLQHGRALLLVGTGRGQTLVELLRAPIPYPQRA